jgi:hypothetical protein
LPVDYELQKTLISKEIKEKKKQMPIAHVRVFIIVNDWMASDYWTTDIPVKKKKGKPQKNSHHIRIISNRSSTYFSLKSSKYQ